MKSLIFFSLFIFSLNAFAEVSRSPAVVGGTCDLDIATTQIKSGSQKVFKEEISHKVVLQIEEGTSCKDLPYEQFAKNEMKLLFQKYSDKYSLKCSRHFQNLGFKKTEFVCEEPMIEAISLQRPGCEKNMAQAVAIIKYQQKGRGLEEKSVAEVQKEQCVRVNECIAQASDKELVELKQLQVVACKNELTPVNTGRAPAIEKDSSFNGRRIPKSLESGTAVDPLVKESELKTIGK